MAEDHRQDQVAHLYYVEFLIEFSSITPLFPPLPLTIFKFCLISAWFYLITFVSFLYFFLSSNWELFHSSLFFSNIPFLFRVTVSSLLSLRTLLITWGIFSFFSLMLSVPSGFSPCFCFFVLISVFHGKDFPKLPGFPGLITFKNRA